MFLNNSYFNVLRKIDKSWEERRHNKRNNTSFWKRQFSKSSSTSSKSLTSCSSDESGLFSTDINSGYYGDDEIDPCPKCHAGSSALRDTGPSIDDYDVISIEVNVREKRRNGSHINAAAESLNFDDEFVVIPSSREEFCSGNLKHSTPNKTSVRKDSLVTCTPRVVTPATQHDNQCSCVTPQKPVRFRLHAPRRSSSDAGVWWRENITWQLKQRNKTQTTNFMQLQDHTNHLAKPKVRINRELADYLNKYAEFRPHNDDLNTAFYEQEPNGIDKSEIIQAIRVHSGMDKTTRLRSNSVAHRAKAYIESQKQNKRDIKDTDDEDYHLSRPRTRSRTLYRETRPMMPRWRENIISQLEMRNFLECKYFTDAIVRRKLSQLSISYSQTDSRSLELYDYDVISDDDVSTVVMNGKSMTTSQSISQGYHSSPLSNHGNCTKDPSAFVIRDLDAVYGNVT